MIFGLKEQTQEQAVAMLTRHTGEAFINIARKVGDMMKPLGVCLITLQIFRGAVVITVIAIG